MEIGKWKKDILFKRAIEYLKDKKMFIDFTDEYSIYWTIEELNYFNISESEIKELDEYGYIEH